MYIGQETSTRAVYSPSVHRIVQCYCLYGKQANGMNRLRAKQGNSNYTAAILGADFVKGWQ